MTIGSAWKSGYQAPSIFYPADLFVGGFVGGWYDFSDTSNCFSDAGTTPITNGGTVQQINDKSGNGNTMSQATAGSRPTWNSAGYAAFDGTADHLFRTSDMGLFAAGNCSFFMLAKANPASNTGAFSNGASGSNNPIYSLHWCDASVATTLAGFVRDDAGSTDLSSDGDLKTSFFDNTKKVTGVTDSGTSVVPYIGSTSFTGTAYSRGTLTMDRSAIGALLRAAAGNFFLMDLYQLVVIGKVLSGTEITNLNTWLGTK